MKSQRKIFRLFSRLNIGGPSLHVVNLASGLDRHGYETTLIVGDLSPGEGSMENYAVEKKVPFLRLRYFQAAISPLKDLFVFVSLVFLFFKEKPDIVHTHTFKAGLVGRLAAWVTGVPLIVHTYHGHLLSGYARPWKVKGLVFIEKCLARLSHQILAVSNKVALDITNAGIVETDKISVIELGFDIPRLRNEISSTSHLRQELNLSPDSKLVGIVGRLTAVKAIDLFIRALVPLLDSNHQVHLVIMGDGEDRLKLETLARTIDPSLARIHFTGWRRPIACDYKELDVCVCSSKNEGTSVSIIEALIAGVPVVSTRVGGMPDLLENGKWGRLTDQTEDSLLLAVSSVLNDPDAKPQAQRASHFFQKRFSETRLIDEMDHLYRSALLENERSRDAN